jgi:hypothetical protein
MNGRIFEHITSAFSRQRDLLAEARRIHAAAGAVRHAREQRAARRHEVSPSVAQSPRPGEPVAPRSGGKMGPVGVPRRDTVWRRAAGRVGSSLVRVGRRLERVGEGRGSVRE